MIPPGASLQPASKPPQITPSARVRALTISPDLLIPPSANKVTPDCFLAFDAAKSAVIWGVPTPATIRVVQIDPGPCPIFITLAPDEPKNSTPSPVVTLPAIKGSSGNASLKRRIASPTPLVCP